jgi:archaellum component FlaC
MTFKPPATWSGETWRWIAAVLVAIISGAVTATWAVASHKTNYERGIERVTDSMARLRESNQQTAVAILKELDAQVGKQELRNESVSRRIAELEAQAKVNQAIMTRLEGLSTEVRYLAQGVAELKQELREGKR